MQHPTEDATDNRSSQLSWQQREEAADNHLAIVPVPNTTEPTRQQSGPPWSQAVSEPRRLKWLPQGKPSNSTEAPLSQGVTLPLADIVSVTCAQKKTFSHKQGKAQSQVDKLLGAIAGAKRPTAIAVDMQKPTTTAVKKQRIREASSHETTKDSTNDHDIKLPQYRWMKQHAKTITVQQQINTFSRLRPPVLGPHDSKERQFRIADQLWSKLFHLVPGTTSRTAALLAASDPEKGKDVLRRMLRTRNARGLASHARNVLAFHAWHLSRWPHLGWLPPDDSPGNRDLYTAILIDFLEDIMDADVSPGVPKAKLGSLDVAIRMCRPQHPWPTDETLVKSLTQNYFREGKHKKRETRLYTAEEIRSIERALLHRPGNRVGSAETIKTPDLTPLERIVLATELRKLYARLRQDDATWGKISDWKLIRTTTTDGTNLVHWHGVASKAKGTEMRANWVHEVMPWIAPTRGLLPDEHDWYNGLTADLQEIGMRPTDDYLLPSPQAVRAGRRPPGATDHLDWINLLRRTLVRIGFAPQQAATVCGHTAKRTMLTWLNASSLVRSDQDQQVLGYHRSKGPGTVARRYTLHEQAGPVRTIDSLCLAIREGRFNPDRPVGTEWDRSSVVLELTWQQSRPPPVVPPLAVTAQTWDSDDEAPPDRNPHLDSDEEAACLLQVKTNGTRSKRQTSVKGYVFTRHDFPKSRKYNIAVIYSEVPTHIIGCKNKERRASVMHDNIRLHVLCDYAVREPEFAERSNIPEQLGQTLCNVCRSRRRRWRIYLAQSPA